MGYPLNNFTSTKLYWYFACINEIFVKQECFINVCMCLKYKVLVQVKSDYLQ